MEYEEASKAVKGLTRELLVAEYDIAKRRADAAFLKLKLDLAYEDLAKASAEPGETQKEVDELADAISRVYNTAPVHNTGFAEAKERIDCEPSVATVLKHIIIRPLPGVYTTLYDVIFGDTK